MKQFIFLLMVSLAFNLNAQDLKSLTTSAESMAKTADTSTFIEKFAGDQVTKLTKKLKLSELQQKQVSSLVVSQLRSDKMQELLSSFSQEQLMGSTTQDKISKTLMNDNSFKSGMDKILTDEKNRLSCK